MAKLTAFQRFLQLTKRKTDEPALFPPPHWTNESQGDAEGPAHPEADVDAVPPSSLNLMPPGEEENDVVVENAADSIPESPPEPAYLARRIQSLMSIMTPDTALSPELSLPGSATPVPEAASGKKLIPAFVTDSKLVSFLSSPSVMNGSASRGRQSVWTLLDRLRAPIPQGERDDEAQDGAPGSNMSVAPEPLDDDNSSIMLYGPLEPDDSSVVEVALSEVISIDDSADPDQAEDGNETFRAHLPKVWPFTRLGDGQPASSPRVHEQKVWIPSPTKISLEVRWWGYRIYLPPPILAILDNQRIEASKRAVLFTTALKWLLDHVPIAVVPLQARPAVMLLRGLVPYLAYISAFIAWSWSVVKNFDKGNGVTLTATWLLPLALVPGTWEDSQFPKGGPTSSETESATASH
ncbi:uncharacterized protein FIBRA_00091 [Fibroporia radiculosa]|uniref:Uncharacterized protein n=1 Tax=Fibroporia radiculosa TaxID=599839 RepID=J7RG61_9APHY|nr:uncharacterized protein FIBRA_00091 [Fibroporia radiculosa]CCL98097.1 predicted protein [Fibroporia radiculosa]